MEKIIEKAKELGLLIKEDPRVKRVAAAQVAVDGNPGIQEKVKLFNEKRDLLIEVAGKDDRDEAEVNKINEEVKAIYDEIMKNPIMKEFNEANSKYEAMMTQVNNIITFYITGEMPQTCSPSACASCGGGCH